MVSEQTCTIDYKTDQSLWQTTLSFAVLHPSHMRTQTLLFIYFYKFILLSNADWDYFKHEILQEILKIHNLLRVEHCAFFWKSDICSNQLDV